VINHLHIRQNLKKLVSKVQIVIREVRCLLQYQYITCEDLNTNSFTVKCNERHILLLAFLDCIDI